MPPAPLTRLRKLCLALPDAYEKEAWGTSTFRVAKGKIFAMYAEASTHAGGGKHGVWINSDATNQELMLRADPKRFFFPPYVGKGGWIGVHLDGATDWRGLRDLLEEGWKRSAPKKLLATLPTPTRRPR